MRVRAGIVALMFCARALAAPPGPPSDLRFDPDAQTLDWSPVAGADAYHVYRGANPGAYDHECLQFRVTGTSAVVAESPAAGALHYFLVSSVSSEGEGPFADGRPNASPCADGDGDLVADNLDNCPADVNPGQQDQNADAVGDRCDPRTYDFETDTPGARPASMTQVGGVNTTFAVTDASGDLGVAYGSGTGQHDVFDRLRAEASFQDTTVYLDHAPTAAVASLELWSEGAYGWNAGGGIIFQIRDDGSMWFYDRYGQSVPGSQGPAVPGSGRLRLRLVKGAGATSTLFVDAWDGSAWVEGYALFDVTDDHRYVGRDVVVADYLGGARPWTRVTVEQAAPPALLTVIRELSSAQDWKVFQRDATGVADVTVRFFHRLGEPGRAEARLVGSIGQAPLPGFDWGDHVVPLGPAPQGEVAGLTLPSVPAGGNYDLEVRLVRDSDSAVLASDAVVEIAVGDVFLAAGQSNMSGYSGSLVGAETPDDTVHLFGNDYRWKRASEPMDDGADQVDRVSQESPAHSLMLRFGKELAASLGLPVGIVPGPLGGTNLYAQWQRNAADPDDRGTLYGSLLHRAGIHGWTDPPAGVLWYQGESDNGRGTDAYRADLQALIANWRQDLAAPGLPVIVAQLATDALSNLTGWTDIQEAQRQVAESDPDVALVTTVDQPRADTVHMTVEGYKEIGARFALAARETVYGEAIDAVPDLLEVRRAGANRQVELVYDRDVTGGDPVLFQVYDDRGNRIVQSVSTLANVVTLQLDQRLRSPGFVSYGFGRDPAASWIEDSAGVPAPLFKRLPVP